jgi:hypothetical protein
VRASNLFYNLGNALTRLLALYELYVQMQGLVESA